MLKDKEWPWLCAVAWLSMAWAFLMAEFESVSVRRAAGVFALLLGLGALLYGCCRKETTDVDE